MNELIAVFKLFFSFFSDNFPTPGQLIVWGPPFLIWSYACLYVSGCLKAYRRLTTAYTRKIFHLLIFLSAAATQMTWGLRVLCLFGAATSVVIVYSILRGDGHILYEAIARESDSPHRTYYIMVPYFATLIGGVSSNVLFGDIAVIGYLVTGLGDAVGEPVGAGFGRHRYRVPSFKGVACTRSYEGSAAVFLVSFISIFLAGSVSPALKLGLHPVYFATVLALICTIVEAISPHGWDNATMQIIPPFCARIILSS